MNLIQRVTDILLKPQSTWAAIAAEDSTPASLLPAYVLPLAAIPAVVGLIGMRHFPLVGLMVAALSYALTVVFLFVMARVVDALAPKFGARPDPKQAFKLVAYSATAGFVGSALGIVPLLGILGLAAALYSIYLLYLGLPALMQCPAEKQAAFTAVIVLCMLVAGFVMGLVQGLVVPTPALPLH